MSLLGNCLTHLCLQPPLFMYKGICEIIQKPYYLGDVVGKFKNKKST